MKARLALAALFLPLLAFAQDAAAPTPVSPAAGALGWLWTPTGIGTLLGLVGLLFGSGVLRKRRVAKAIYHAFHIVEDVDSEFEPGTTGTKLDKALEGLKAADAWMVANGWRPLKPGEQELAKLEFKAMNGATEVSKGLASPK